MERRGGKRETVYFHARVKNVVLSVEWPFFAPYVKAINELKKQRNAVIRRTTTRRRKSTIALPISSVTSLQLAREATKVDADVIVQAGVHFMAETAKILILRRRC